MNIVIADCGVVTIYRQTDFYLSTKSAFGLQKKIVICHHGNNILKEKKQQHWHAISNGGQQLATSALSYKLLLIGKEMF